MPLLRLPVYQYARQVPFDKPHKKHDTPPTALCRILSQRKLYFLDAFYDAILKNLPPNYLLGEGFFLERYLNSPTDTPADELLTEVWLPIIPQ